MPVPARSAASTQLEVSPAAPQSCRALDPVAVRLGQFDAGLHQQLLHEGVADLHGRATLVGALVELDRGEGRAVDAVATRVRPDQHQRVAGPSRGGREEVLTSGRRRRTSR